MPVYAHFGSGPFHTVAYAAEWDVEGMLAAYGEKLIRTRTGFGRRRRHADHVKGMSVLFRPDEDLFVYCDGRDLAVYASEHARAEAELRRLVGLYATARRRKEEASFKVLEIFSRSIQTHDVPVPLSARQSRRDLSLHYGEDFPEWEVWFASVLRSRRNTISVLQGEPGTGKTSFLRHLIVRLRRTHRFYFVPPNEVSFLLQTTALGFWITEYELASERPPVLIIEDGERVLLRRGPDNHQDVSNILNIADGLLGHCVHAHVICTVNCAEPDIDSAVMRPGRLLACRPFGRLTREAARRIAERKRLTLPDQESYTLAEVYHGRESRSSAAPSPHRAGFGAAREPIATTQPRAA